MTTSYSATFSGYIPYADLGTTGTFSANVTFTSTTVAGTWSYNGSYDGMPYWGLPGFTGSVSFSGVLADIVHEPDSIPGVVDFYQVSYVSADSRWGGSIGEQAGLLTIMWATQSAQLDVQVSFRIPYNGPINPGQEYADAYDFGYGATVTLNSPILGATTNVLPPVISISTYPATVTGGATSVTITLERSGADLSNISTVQVYTQEGSATSQPVTVTFQANAGSATVTVPIVQNKDLTFDVILANPSNGTLGFDDANISYLISSGITVAAALAAGSQLSSSAVISDSAQNVSGSLDSLEKIVGNISTITLTDSTTPTLTVTPAQSNGDAAVLHKITSPYHMVVKGLSADVASNLDVLQGWASGGILTGVTFTDPGTPSLALTATQVADDMTVLGVMTGTGIVTVSDSSTNVLTDLAPLETLAASGKLSSITLTDSGTPSLALTAAQLSQDASALHAIKGSYSLNVSGVTAAVASFVMGEDAIRQSLGLPAGYNETAGIVTGGGDSVIGWQSAALPAGENSVVLNASRSSYALQIDGTGQLVVKDIGAGDPTYGQSITVSGATYLILDGAAASSPGLYSQPIFIESGAHATIARLYEATLGRLPDLSGLEQWIAAYDSGAQSLAQIEQGFVGSAEFAVRYPGSSDSAFVTALYENTLNRSPDATGLAGWLAQIAADEAAGMTVTAARATVVDGFMTSQEFISDTASWLVDPTTGGYADAGMLIPAATVLTQATANAYCNTALIDPTSLGGTITTSAYQLAGDVLTVLPGAAPKTVLLSANVPQAVVENAGSTIYAQGAAADVITLNGGTNSTVVLGNSGHDVVYVLGGTNSTVYAFTPGQGSAVIVANSTTPANLQILNGSVTPVAGASLSFGANSAIIVDVGSIGAGTAASVAAAANKAYQVAEKPYEHVTFMGTDSNGSTEFWFFGSTANAANGIVPAASLAAGADANANHQVDAAEITHIATIVGVAPTAFAAADLA